MKISVDGKLIYELAPIREKVMEYSINSDEFMSKMIYLIISAVHKKYETCYAEEIVTGKPIFS